MTPLPLIIGAGVLLLAAVLKKKTPVTIDDKKVVTDDKKIIEDVKIDDLPDVTSGFGNLPGKGCPTGDLPEPYRAKVYANIDAAINADELDAFAKVLEGLRPPCAATAAYARAKANALRAAAAALPVRYTLRARSSDMNAAAFIEAWTGSTGVDRFNALAAANPGLSPRAVHQVSFHDYTDGGLIEAQTVEVAAGVDPTVIFVSESAAQGGYPNNPTADGMFPRAGMWKDDGIVDLLLRPWDVGMVVTVPKSFGPMPASMA